MSRSIMLLAAFAFPSLGILCSTHSGKSVDWPVYDGEANGDHYSDLTQINRENVKSLTAAWTYDSGESGGLETSPIVVGDVLYALTPTHRVIALDAATGKLLWQFDPGVPGRSAGRGVTYWTDGHESRIFAPVRNYLYAIDASNGKPIPSFGENGRIDLRKGLGGDYRRGLQRLDYCGWREPGDASRPAWRHSRIGCADGGPALDIPHHSPAGRIRI
jgi:glucose dehydrogenase